MSQLPRLVDTVEGIAEWWQLEQRIRRGITEVKKALEGLVAQGMVLERTDRDGRVHYRVNPRKKRNTTRRPLPAASKGADK